MNDCILTIELPWPPTFVRALLVNDSLSKSVVVNLTWIPNFDGNIPIERYTIQMKEGSSSDSDGVASMYDDLGWQNKEDMIVSKNQTKMWTLIRGLRPFTTYRFRLSAWNQLGEGNLEVFFDSIHCFDLFLGQVSDPSNNVTLPEESKIIYPRK